MGSRKMETCRLCHCTTSGQRNDLFDEMVFDMQSLAGYLVEQRYNQAGNVLIRSASKLIQTFEGCCADDESIQKYGKETIRLIELGMEISKMSEQNKFDSKG